MKKKLLQNFLKKEIVKVWRIMRLLMIFSFCFAMTVSASIYSQNTKLNLELKDVTLREALNYVEQNSEFIFLYKNEEVDINRKVNINLQNALIDEVLGKLLEGQKVSYKILGRQVVITRPGNSLQGFQVNQTLLEISGKITDSSGQALPGVTVVIKGTTNGVVSDAKGNYSLANVPSNATLVFSFVGMKTQEISVAGETSINVSMLEDAIDIEEVVAVGYGTMRKSDLTGALTRVSESENIARQYSTVDAILQGRAAGVNVISNAGNPGGAISVRIRGTNSLRGNNEPLYVVDGIIINSAGEDVNSDFLDGAELQNDQNGLTGLNPRDIESIEILKDASATAIYGSRGANGVVLITTKQGNRKMGKSKINVYASSDISWMAKKVDLLGPIPFAEYHNEASELIGRSQAYHIEGNEVYPITYDTGTPVIETSPIKQVDWQDKMYNMAFSHNEGVSITDSKDKTNYYFSAGYSNTKGIVETTNFDQGDFRFNFSSNPISKLKFDNRVSMMYLCGEAAPAGSRLGGSRSFVTQVLKYVPFVKSVDENIDIEDLVETSNPFSWIEGFDDLNEEIRSNISTSLDYEIIKGLSYNLRVGVDYRMKERSRWYGIELGAGERKNGLANYSKLRRYSFNIDNIVNYNFKINKNNSFSLTAGMTYDQSNLRNEIYHVIDFPVKILKSEVPQLGQTIELPLRYIYAKEEIFSLLGRVNYNYKNKYIFTGSFRADQSSKFSPDKQWGYFPSGALAWRLSEEDFIKETGVFDNLKVRLGWGLTGNQAIKPYQTKSTYDTGNYVGPDESLVISNIPSRIANSDLTWETTEQYNAGIDISLFGNRINATVDAYYKMTKDLLQYLNLPNSSGFGSMAINRGKLENRGIELSLDGLLINGSDFKLDAGLRIAINKNKVVDLGLPSSPVWINGIESQETFYLGKNISTGDYFKAPANIFMEGREAGMFWGYQTNGIYQSQTEADAGATFPGSTNQPGDVIYVDQNGDGSITFDDCTFIGNPNPDFTFGFDIGISYKGFTLKALFDGVYGNEIANGYNLFLNVPEAKANILSSAYQNAWRVDNPSNKIPRIGYSFVTRGFCDYIIEDGSYLRLNNVTIGYDIPALRNFIERINIYASARNVFYLTKYSGYEPQITSFIYDGNIMGVDWAGTPNISSILLGLNITF